MMRPVTLAGIGILVGVLCSCGSSHRTGLHDYSVREVEVVFATQGISLHTARQQPVLGITKLVWRGVEVEVAQSGTVLSSTFFGSPREHSAARANVTVNWQPGYTKPVTAALRGLG